MTTESTSKTVFLTGATGAMGLDVVVASLNGQPALIGYNGDKPDTAMLFDTTSAGITAIYVVRNPEKLRRLARPMTT